MNADDVVAFCSNLMNEVRANLIKIRSCTVFLDHWSSSLGYYIGTWE